MDDDHILFDNHEQSAVVANNDEQRANEISSISSEERISNFATQLKSRDSTSYYSLDIKTEIDKYIFCYNATDLALVLRSRVILVTEGLLPPYISLQEMLWLWEPLDLIRVHRIRIRRTSRKFTFISHMHAPTPDKLGTDVIESIESMPDDMLVWMDLCSMCQDNVYSGYTYEEHTRPVVEKLHIIMSMASEACILLNKNVSGSDPLKIGEAVKRTLHYASALIGSCKRYAESTKRKDDLFCLEDCQYMINYCEELKKTIWTPSNDYYGRLWCYVERIAMKPGYIYEYPGRIKIDPKDCIDKIAFVYKYVYAMRKSNYPCYDQITHDEFRNLLNYLSVKYFSLFGNDKRIVPIGKGIDKAILSENILSTLSPFTQLQLLDCYCDADRVIVAEIESNVRKETIEKATWVYGLQIALCSPYSSIGKARKISAENFQSEQLASALALKVSTLLLWLRQLAYLCELSIYQGEYHKSTDTLIFAFRTKENIFILKHENQHWVLKLKQDFECLRILHVPFDEENGRPLFVDASRMYEIDDNYFYTSSKLDGVLSGISTVSIENV